MRTSRFGQLLLVIGGVVGVAAVVGLVVGFEPARLPPALVNIAVYKLSFVAAAGLLAAGAILHRYARRAERAHEREEALLADNRNAVCSLRALRLWIRTITVPTVRPSACQSSGETSSCWCPRK
jgi:hypothetical protein